MENKLEHFCKFVKARESLRENKEAKLFPLTLDPILRDYSFCNVNRQHDAVTIWINENVRDSLEYVGSSMKTTFVNMFLARIFNEPNTLKEILPIWEVASPPRVLQGTLSILKELRKEGKIMRGAYMVAPHGSNGKGQTPEDYFIRAAEQLSKITYSEMYTFKQLAYATSQVLGCGPFFINQVVADLRYMSLWRDFKDWNTFVLAGPGTQRGLNRFHGRKVTKGTTQEKMHAELMQIREEVGQYLPFYIIKYFRDPNNLSNCFCEYDKYCRAHEQLAANKRITLRRYKNAN